MVSDLLKVQANQIPNFCKPRDESIVPNPAVGSSIFNYKLNQASSAYLMIVSYYMGGGVSNNYILDTNSTETTINLNNYPIGLYKAVLVANGAIVDVKILSKQ